MQITYILREGVEVVGKTDRRGEWHHYVGNTCVSLKGGRTVLTLHDRDIDPCAHILMLVEKVHIWDVDGKLRRHPGHYALGQATAVVTCPSSILVDITAPTKDEALALYDRIMVGDILPEIETHGAQIPLPQVDPDRLAALEKRASDLAMMLLEKAMAKLAERVGS